MSTRIADLHILREERLPTPADLRAAVPVGDAEASLISPARTAVRDILHGRDDRLMVLTRPCSVHDPDAALEYARRLRDAAPRFADARLPVMRVYWVACAGLAVTAGSEILDLVTPPYYCRAADVGRDRRHHLGQPGLPPGAARRRGGAELRPRQRRRGGRGAARPDAETCSRQRAGRVPVTDGNPGALCDDECPHLRSLGDDCVGLGSLGAGVWHAECDRRLRRDRNLAG